MTKRTAAKTTAKIETTAQFIARQEARREAAKIHAAIVARGEYVARCAEIMSRCNAR